MRVPPSRMPGAPRTLSRPSPRGVPRSPRASWASRAPSRDARRPPAAASLSRPGRAYRGLCGALWGAAAAHGPDAGRARRALRDCAGALGVPRLRDPARRRPHGPGRRSEVRAAGEWRRARGGVGRRARRRGRGGAGRGGAPGRGPCGRAVPPRRSPRLGGVGEGSCFAARPLPLQGPQPVRRVTARRRGAGGSGGMLGTRAHAPSSSSSRTLGSARLRGSANPRSTFQRAN